MDGREIGRRGRRDGWSGCVDDGQAFDWMKAVCM